MKIMEIDLKNRNCLQAIRELAENAAENVENPFWSNAYADLATAADRLDAMEARCNVMEKYSDGVPQTMGR